MKWRWLLLIAAGEALTFLAQYEPFRVAVRTRLQALANDLVTQAQYEEAIRQTLQAIRHLPETEGG